MRCHLCMIVMALSLAACGPARPSIDEQIEVAVEGTVAAMSTEAPPAIPSPIATATNVPLKGLFCEYQFCIRHPDGMPFFDAVAKQNPSAPTASSFDEGILGADNASLFIEVRWQTVPVGSDGQFMLDRILDSGVDTRNGDVEPILVRDLNVFFVPIATTATAVLPYGGAAAWICSGRAFGWKAYAMQPDVARNLLLDALQAFRCEG